MVGGLLTVGLVLLYVGVTTALTRLLPGSGTAQVIAAAVVANATISRRLVLSPRTVRNHVANVLTKLNLPDRSAAILRAREAGLGQDHRT